jgi:hypothetical protein
MTVKDKDLNYTMTVKDKDLVLNYTMTVADGLKKNLEAFYLSKLSAISQR